MKLSQPIFFFLLTAMLGFSSCDEQRVYETNIDIKGNHWEEKDTLSHTFEIKDNLPKNLYINVRHQFDFAWRNMWLQVALKFPNDSIYSFPVNIAMSQPDGQWFGDCSGDVCLLQFPLADYTNYAFQDTGKYTLIMAHEMRENPLASVMSMGLRVENIAKTVE
jgi:gliding motility-associated lipoprotein GldH